jgi:predicted nucleic acid-binding protein
MSGDDRRIFLDTNVLVFANIEEAPFHEVALNAVQSHEQAGMDIWISRQVLREYLATLSRPQTFTSSLPPEKLESQIGLFIDRFHIAEDTAQVTEQLLMLIQQVSVGGKQVHDANIVATMRAYNIPTLLTYNTADFSRFAAYITVLPLETNTP